MGANLFPCFRVNGAAAGALLALLAATATGARADVAPACLGEAPEARGAGAEDARSLRLEDGRTLRVAGMESFALLIAEGTEADAALQRRLHALIAGVPLRIRILSDTPDRYGRVAALVAAEGRLLQETLASEGTAIAFASGEPIPCFAEIIDAEGSARLAGRGFWAGESLRHAWPGSLEARIGRFAIFEGDVISVGNRSARTYVNFGDWWAKDVTVEIEGKDRERFGGEAELAKLAGARVRVRGFLEERNGPALTIRSPMQLQILNETLAAGEDAP